MINLNNGFFIKSNAYNQPPKEEGLINKMLPTEILKEIFSYLQEKDLQKTTLIGNWSQLTIHFAKDTAKQNLNKSIDFLVKTLQEKLGESQKNRLSSIASKSEIVNAKTLPEVKSSFNDEMKAIFEVLGELEVEDFTTLQESYKKSSFFCKIFHNFLGAYQALSEANSLSDDAIDKQLRYIKVCEQFAGIGMFDKAIEIVNQKILCLEDKGCMFLMLCQKLFSEGLFDKGIELTQKIPNHVKVYSFPAICIDLAMKGQLDAALNIADKMPQRIKEKCLELMYKTLLKNNNVDEAIKVRSKMTLG